MVKPPNCGRFVWYLYNYHFKGANPPEPKQRITIRLPQSLMEQLENIFNTLVQRYSTRAIHSLGELDRETYALGLSIVLARAEAQAV
jgi:hypothetical protein